MFSNLSIRWQCDVLIVSIAAIHYHQNWCILHGAHQEHVSAQGETSCINGKNYDPVMHTMVFMYHEENVALQYT
jgi:hypothetical protein